MFVGKRLRNLRRQKGFTQSELAQLLGAKEDTVSHWETGRSQPRADRIYQLCKLFGVSADYLLGLEQSTRSLTHGSYSALQFKRTAFGFEKVVCFEVPGRCIPAPRMTYYGKRSPRTIGYMSYREEIAWSAKEAKVPCFEGPVAVGVDIYLYKRGREGDIDNYQKTILDALNGVAWRDDRQIVEIQARKHYVTNADLERILVMIKPADTNYTPEKEVATG